MVTGKTKPSPFSMWFKHCPGLGFQCWRNLPRIGRWRRLLGLCFSTRGCGGDLGERPCHPAEFCREGEDFILSASTHGHCIRFSGGETEVPMPQGLSSVARSCPGSWCLGSLLWHT